MWNIISRMGSVESKFKAGGYHTHALNGFIGGMGPLGPINPDKQFPCFKSDPSQLCRQNYNMSRPTEPPNSSPKTPEPKQNQQCNNKKKRRRRRRRKKKSKNCQTTKNKPMPERQRHLSTTSEDSFIMFDENCSNCPISDSSDDETETIEDVYSSDSTITHKKVRFADDLCEVHPMVMWAYAYQAARKGPWEEYARDRDRFHQRVISIEADIGHVFNSQHRTRIYNERFSSS